MSEGKHASTSPVGFAARTAYAVLRVATACLFPLRGPVIAGIRFCRRHGLLFLGDWRTDIAPLVVTGRAGETYVVNTKDTTVGVSVRRTAEFDFGKFQLALELLPEGFQLETLFDIGANIGTICIPAVRRGLAKRAISFEPDPGNYRLLVANIYLNGLQELIRHHDVALGSEDGVTLCLELAPSNFGDHRVRVSDSPGTFDESNRPSVKVASARFDSIVDGMDPATSLIWMDVQGYEGRVLEGAANALRARVFLVTELWPYGLARAKCLELFKNAIAGYESFYDLGQSQPRARPISEIGGLIERLSGSGDSTDVLLC